MLVIISYDITDDKKRTRLAKKLRDFGKRVQKSVFEADITEKELVKLKQLLSKRNWKPRIVFVFIIICEACEKTILIWGSGEVTEDEDYYIV